jgi:hypothetical protein
MKIIITESQYKLILRESKSLEDKIYSKLKKQGKHSLTADEKEYLKQLTNKEVDSQLEKWLNDDDENTFDEDGNKLKFDEFDDDEDVLLNPKKTIRILNKHFGKSFKNNADWGGAKVWSIDDDNFVGRFIFYGDDELLYLKREMNDDEYEDDILETINDGKDFNKLVLKLKKNENNNK